MTHTVFSTMSNRDLLRMVDSMPAPTQLEIELAERLTAKMADAEFKSPNAGQYVGDCDDNA